MYVDYRQVGTGFKPLSYVSNKQKCVVSHMATQKGSFLVRFDRASLRAELIRTAALGSKLDSDSECARGGRNGRA